jgi:hypothetical protein
MKLKFLLFPLALATMLLVSCGDDATPTPTPDPTPSGDSTPAKVWEYLDFVADGKVRFDVFDFKDGLQISYGNEALANATNTVSLNNNATISMNKNLANEDSFNMIIIAEKNGSSAYTHLYLGVEGDHITDLNALVSDSLKTYERAYVAVSIAEKAKWTKNLNTSLDTYLTAATTKEN